MEFYIVGGWVRDHLMEERGYAVEPKDKDWLVVGAKPEQMETLGYKKVGNAFPVFIDPKTGEEYALARTEKKKGHGYHGFDVWFSPEVTLEEDLKRRDLTINAIALDKNGKIHDPYGGVRDIDKKVLRHVSPAFADDPVRLLRVARFAAKFPTFKIAPETMKLMRSLVDNAETDYLVGERTGQELLKALGERKPSAFFKALEDSGYWQRHYPDWKISPATLKLMDSIEGDDEVKARFAVMFSDADPSRVEDYANTFKPTKELLWFATRYRRLEGKVPPLASTPAEKAKFLLDAQSLQYPQRFSVLLKALSHELTSREIEFWTEAREAFSKVDSEAVLAKTPDPAKLQEAFLEARTKKLAEVSDKFANQQDNRSD